MVAGIRHSSRHWLRCHQWGELRSAYVAPADTAAEVTRMCVLGGADFSTTKTLRRWSSWNALRCGVSEKQIRATAAGLVASGLRDVGYRYINIGARRSIKLATLAM